MPLSGQLGVKIPPARPGMPIRPLEGPAQEAFFAKPQFHFPLILFNAEGFLLDFQTLGLIPAKKPGYL